MPIFRNKPKNITVKDKITPKESMTILKRTPEQQRKYQEFITAIRNGVDPATLEYPDDASYYYTTNMPELVYKQGTHERSMVVTLASSEEDEGSVLHMLFKKLVH